MSLKPAKPISRPLRPCVLGVFRDANNNVLVCERADEPGSWQLPQGGVESGENAEQAVMREMEEELGVNQFKLVATALTTVDYTFPDTLQKPITKKFSGQSQIWYLLEFQSSCEPKLECAETREFVDWRWVSVQNALELAVDWKKDSYRRGFEKFYLL